MPTVYYVLLSLTTRKVRIEQMKIECGDGGMGPYHHLQYGMQLRSDTAS